MEDVMGEMDELGPEILEEFRPRTALEAARRALVLNAISNVATRSEHLVDWLQKEGLWDAVSPAEKAFLQSTSSSQQERATVKGSMDALLPLLWALRRINDLPPATVSEPALIKAAMPPLFSPTSQFLSAAKLRGQSEIDQMLEQVYQAHWTARDAMLHNRPDPNGNNTDILQQRHRALNWLIGYCNQDWDDVSTDT